MVSERVGLVACAREQIVKFIRASFGERASKRAHACFTVHLLPVAARAARDDYLPFSASSYNSSSCPRWSLVAA